MFSFTTRPALNPQLRRHHHVVSKAGSLQLIVRRLHNSPISITTTLLPTLFSSLCWQINSKRFFFGKGAETLKACRKHLMKFNFPLLAVSACSAGRDGVRGKRSVLTSGRPAQDNSGVRPGGPERRGAGPALVKARPPGTLRPQMRLAFHRSHCTLPTAFPTISGA